MRGVVSAGMTVALEQLASAMCSTRFMARPAGARSTRPFSSPGRLPTDRALINAGSATLALGELPASSSGASALDMDHVITYIWTYQRPLRYEAILSSAIDLHCTATDADRAEMVDLAALGDAEEIRCALRATGRARRASSPGPPRSFPADAGRSTRPWPSPSRFNLRLARALDRHPRPADATRGDPARSPVARGGGAD